MENTTNNLPTKGWGILLFVSILILVLLYFASNWKSSIKVKNIEIEGTELLSSAEILDTIEKNMLLNKDNLREINQKIKENPYIKNSYISHKSISEIKIEVNERKPLAILLKDNGEKMLIDTEGNLLPYHKFADTLNLPVFSGIFHNNKLDTTRYNIGYDIIKYINDKKAKVLDGIKYKLEYDSENCSFMIKIAEKNIEGILGKETNLKDKVDNFIAILNSGLLNKSKTNPQLIDLRWENQIVIKNK